MASYTTATKVAVLLGYDDFTTTTRPTLAQVNTIISDITFELDFVLSSVGITTQPTDLKILARLDLAAKYGTAGQVGMSIGINSDSVNGSQGNIYSDKYEKILREIKTDPEYYGKITGDAMTYMSNPISDGTMTQREFDGVFVNTNYKY